MTMPEGTNSTQVKLNEMHLFAHYVRSMGIDSK